MIDKQVSDFSSGFCLWPHKETYPYSHPMQYDRDTSPEKLFAKAWLDRFNAYDYGAMTVWLMRGFGLPNIKGYDSHKHGFTWALQTPNGYVIEIEPKLISISKKQYKDAFDKRNPNSKSWSREDFVNQLSNGVFKIIKIKQDAPELDESILNSWLDEFARPIYIRDVGASVIGNIFNSPWLSDVGPDHPMVLNNGAKQVNTPTPPPSIHKNSSNSP